MNWKKWGMFLVSLVMFCCCSTALAENHVDSIDIEVELRQDGSAVITQIWSGNFQEGTECYLPISDSGYLTVSDLSAACDSTLYETMNDWDVNADFDEKAYRCGIRRVEDGYELCWGISEYGKHEYTISYVVDPLVCGYDEADGFNFMFVNPNMNIAPTDVAVYLYSPDMALTEQNTSAWAFGFEGQVRFESDGVCVWTDSDHPIGNEDYVIVMLKLDKGMFAATRDMNKSFDEALEEAKQGSDYQKENTWWEYFSIAFWVLGIGLTVSKIISNIRRKRALKELCAKYADIREIPCEGNFAAMWHMGRLLGCIKEEGGIIGALLMCLLRDGCIIPVENTVSEKNAKDMPLQMLHAPQSTFSPEALLYNLLLEACDENGILDPKYVKRFFKKNPDVMRRLLTNIGNRERDWLAEKGYFQGKPCGDVRKLTEAGQKEIAMLLNLQTALREESEVGEWLGKMTPEECCALVLLFGIKKEAIKGIRAYYPGYVQEDYWMTLYGYYWFSSYYHDYSYGEMRRAEQMRSGGSGGSSSYGGGGGFSGGGNGGGTR